MNKNNKKNILIISTGLAGTYFLMDYVAKYRKETESIDKENPYLNENDAVTSMREAFYEGKIKPLLDKALSFGGLLAFTPLYLGIAVAIYLNDPGPIFFMQQRVGKNKKFFQLHKFRTMKLSAPHDVPTHELENPECYITDIGKFLRKYSLDELPQVWDIFRGKMSIIGPRPALWNQEDLVAERDKYGANDVLPGLTGWAQINGRDELKLSEKAKFDGEYARILKQGGFQALLFDAKCFFSTISSVLKHDGVIEGSRRGLKSQYNVCTCEVGFDEYGFKKTFNIDKKRNIRVLICGAGSYIGESFKGYVEKYYPNIECSVLDMINGEWREKDFKSYDTVFHVAGIAHSDVGKVSAGVQKKYYEVNTNLAIETCQKAKENGVKQFILMSSMIVYGDVKYVNEHTIPSPVNFYGDSKWQADKGVRELSSDTFHVAVLRPPMIYGYGSKGNYPTLERIARNVPFFPDYKNCRSILYIENLCEFIALISMSGEGGIYFPQNAEYSNTTELVRRIGNTVGKRTIVSRFFNPAVRIALRMPGKISSLAGKAFGNCYYDQRLSRYEGLYYTKISFEESIKRTEGIDTVSNKSNFHNTRDIYEYSNNKQSKNALIVASVASMIDQFIIPNIKLLIEIGYNVDVATNFKRGSTCTDAKIKELIELLNSLSVDCYHIDFNRKVTDVKADMRAYRQVDDVVRGMAEPINKFRHHHIVKSNGYSLIHSHSPIGGVVGRMIAYKHRIESIYTAHGFHFYEGAPKKNWILFYPIEKELSRITDVLITINREDYRMAKEHFYARKTVYMPGVGMDMEKFSSKLINPEEKRRELGISHDTIFLLSVGELIERKNHEIVLKALTQLPSSIQYYIAGKGELEDELRVLAKTLKVDTRVHFLGFRTDISELCQAADIFILPSHQEGLSLALMEAISCKVPVVCSKIRGNTDIVNDGRFLFDENNVDDVIRVLKPLISNGRDGIKTLTDEMVANNIRTLGSYNLKSVEKLMRTEYEALGGYRPGRN